MQGFFRLWIIVALAIAPGAFAASSDMDETDDAVRVFDSHEGEEGDEGEEEGEEGEEEEEEEEPE